MALRLLEQFRISLPPAADPRPPLPLTFFDIPWLDLSPVESLFFYRSPISAAGFLESHFPDLKSSLALTLKSFYPLAGAIRRQSGSDHRFEMSYFDGDSVALAVYECKYRDFDDVANRHARPFGMLKELVPVLPRSVDAQPLLAVQITLFPNQGLCLALSIHHAACDGFSSIHFLKSWAAASRTTPPPPPPPPSLDRSSISDPLDLYSKLARFVILRRSLPRHPSSQSPPPPLPIPLTAATFTIPSSLIRNLKLRLMSEAEERGKPPVHISTFVVSSACAWTCLVKAKGYDHSRTAHLLFPVDWRNRMRPPPPANYFGNCLGCPCFVRAGVGEIVAEKEGIFMVCDAIGKAIEGIGGDVREAMEGLFEKIMEVLPQQPLSIAGSPKLRVYEVNFGWGKPEKVELTSIGETGAISMAESRDDEGGAEIGVVLTEEEIDEFGKQFLKLQVVYGD